MHAVADVHDTALRKLPRAPALGLGVGWIAQVVPFHTAANVFSGPVVNVAKSAGESSDVELTWPRGPMQT